MANELTWQQIEAAFYDYLANLSERELRELEDWLNENEEVPNFFDQPEDFVRLRDEARGWLHSHKKEMERAGGPSGFASFPRGDENGGFENFRKRV